MDFHAIISSYSYIGIFLLLVLNGIFNFPSSQIIYLITGYFVSKGNLEFLPTILSGALGNTIGNAILFLLIKKHGKTFARKIIFMNEEKFDKVCSSLEKTFSKNGLLFIFFGKLIPSVKAFIPTIAGLARTATIITIVLFFVASVIWAAILNAIGFYFGENFSLTSFSLISVLIGLIIIYFFYKKFSKTSSSI